MNEQHRQQRQIENLPGRPVIGYPINRRRQPMATRTEVSAEEHAKRQKAAAQITEETAEASHPLVDTLLTTREHLGKIPEEPDRKNEVASVNLPARGEDMPGVKEAIARAEERTEDADEAAEAEPVKPDAETVKAAGVAKAAGKKDPIRKRFGKK
jgi:hypothetical protein